MLSLGVLGVIAPLGVAGLFFGYLNNNAFPSPLSEKEERDILERFANGDTGARNILIERNLRLVAHVCKKFESTGIDKDDLISLGTIGLIKAINSYSVDRGARLASYAARCIENELLMFLRSSQNMRSEVSLNDPIGTDKEGNEMTLLELLADGEQDVSETVEQDDNRRLICSKLDILTETERYVLIFRYGLLNYPVLTQREIAKTLDISRSYVSRIEKKAINKLKKEIKGTIFL